MNSRNKSQIDPALTQGLNFTPEECSLSLPDFCRKYRFDPALLPSNIVQYAEKSGSVNMNLFNLKYSAFFKKASLETKVEDISETKVEEPLLDEIFDSTQVDETVDWSSF